jgi:hypothetical protein
MDGPAPNATVPVHGLSSTCLVGMLRQGALYGRPRARTPTMSVANATMRATPDTARVATNSRIDCSRTLRIARLSGSADVNASIASIVSVSRPDPSR